MGFSQAFNFFRHRFFVWLHHARMVIFFHATSPVLFILSLGYGMTKLMTPENAENYLAFIIPGFACSSLMLAVNLNVYSTFRTIERGIMTAVMVTPMRLSELTAGEVAYGSFRGVVIAIIVMILGLFMQTITISWVLLFTLLFFILGALTMSAMTVALASAVKDHENCDLITPLVNMPSLLFCGVFVPIANYPEWVQALVHIYPVFHMVELVRPAAQGAFVWAEAWPHLIYLLALLAFFGKLAHYYLKKRLFD